MLPSIFSGQADSDNTAILALADGTCFRGISVGASGVCTAQLVFNTLLTGHQEAITDPSYAQQIVVFTYPHIGSTGVNNQDSQSDKAQVSGLVMRDCSLIVSNFRATQSLPDYLKQQGVVAIAGIDTRKLTRIIRENGRQSACIMVGNNAQEAVALAQQFAADQAKQSAPALTSAAVQQPANQPLAEAGASLPEPVAAGGAGAPHIAAYNFGIKSGVLNAFASRGCKLTIVSPNTPVSSLLSQGVNAVFLSSGPGHPESSSQHLDLARELVDKAIPTLAVGLGMQLVAKSQGATIEELKVGNHGCNHPVKSIETSRVFISSQKQEFAVSQHNLPSNIKPTHISLFDGSLQGFELENAPVTAIQAYPEASPGPSDLTHIFDQFISKLNTNK